MNASTGILLLDFVCRPFLKVFLKFPIVGLAFLFVVYGVIGYTALKSAFLAENTY